MARGFSFGAAFGFLTGADFFLVVTSTTSAVEVLTFFLGGLAVITTSGRSLDMESLRLSVVEVRVLMVVSVVELLLVREGLRGVFSLKLEVLGGEVEVEVEGLS